MLVAELLAALREALLGEQLLVVTVQLTLTVLRKGGGEEEERRRDCLEEFGEEFGVVVLLEEEEKERSLERFRRFRGFF